MRQGGAWREGGRAAASSRVLRPGRPERERLPGAREWQPRSGRSARLAGVGLPGAGGGRGGTERAALQCPQRRAGGAVPACPQGLGEDLAAGSLRL